jgi:hypothetical protein
MRVGGYDISTHKIDCVLVDLDDLEPPVWISFPFKGADAWERTRTVAQVVNGRAFWEEWGLYAAGIEVPFGFSSAKVSMIIGVLLTRLPPDILIERWPNNSWRKAVGLKGGGMPKKEMKTTSVAKSVELLAGSGITHTEAWTVDAHEAHLIAVATRTALSSERRAA